MNTQEVKTVGCRKAWIAFVAASSCLLIYVMACVMSPPGWSPDSSKIAILVTPPGKPEDTKEFAIFVYDIATGAHTLLDEVKADGVLSAPAWSPDGKWIAYYKVEPTPSEQVRPSSEPNAALSIGEVPRNTPEDKPDRSAPSVPGEQLFSEENQMLPPFMFELAEERVKDKNDVETFDVKLVIATPDGKDKETLQVMKWVGGDDERQSMVLMKPTWSPDCKRLFYVRAIGEGDSFYIASIDIATGTTYAHLPGSVVAPVVSPDGKWVASYLEDGTLVASGTNGSVCKYFKLDLEPVDGGPPMLDFTFWSPDSRKILVFDKDSVLHGIDIASGQTELYKDPDANSIAYPVISSTDKKLYYLGGFRTGEEGRPPHPPQTISLKRMDLQTKRTHTIFTFRMPELSDDGGALFSISPNGKVVLARAVMNDAFEKERSVLIFWDGKTQKIVKTDRWLLKPLYGDSNLIFEDKLIGKWRGEDSRISIAKGTQEKTYKLTWVEEDKERHAVANLVRLKGMTFLGVFLDESLVEPGSHLLPDMFMRVVQTEPKLTLQAIEYNELAEVLQKAAESIRPEDIGTEGIAEFERAK